MLQMLNFQIPVSECAYKTLHCFYTRAILQEHVLIRCPILEPVTPREGPHPVTDTPPPPSPTVITQRVLPDEFFFFFLHLFLLFQHQQPGRGKI